MHAELIGCQQCLVDSLPAFTSEASRRVNEVEIANGITCLSPTTKRLFSEPLTAIISQWSTRMR